MPRDESDRTRVDVEVFRHLIHDFRIARAPVGPSYACTVPSRSR